MTPDELKARSRTFAVRLVRFVRTLTRTDDARVMGRQLLRSGTSVGANYRAVCRARSDAEFVAKLGLVIEECDESAFWLELLIETEVVAPAAGSALLTEADELTRIFVASRETVRRRMKTRRNQSRAEP